jgi:hypothetical protein
LRVGAFFHPTPAGSGPGPGPGTSQGPSLALPARIPRGLGSQTVRGEAAPRLLGPNDTTATQQPGPRSAVAGLSGTRRTRGGDKALPPPSHCRSADPCVDDSRQPHRLQLHRLANKLHPPPTHDSPSEEKMPILSNHSGSALEAKVSATSPAQSDDGERGAGWIPSSSTTRDGHWAIFFHFESSATVHKGCASASHRFHKAEGCPPRPLLDPSLAVGARAVVCFISIPRSCLPSTNPAVVGVVFVPHKHFLLQVTCRPRSGQPLSYGESGWASCPMDGMRAYWVVFSKPRLSSLR